MAATDGVDAWRDADANAAEDVGQWVMVARQNDLVIILSSGDCAMKCRRGERQEKRSGKEVQEMVLSRMKMQVIGQSSSSAGNNNRRVASCTV